MTASIESLQYTARLTQPPMEINNGWQLLQRENEIAQNTIVRPYDINDDEQMTMIVAHVLKPEEKLGQFYSRTGLSKAQAALMSKAEILAFCLAADKNNEANGVKEPKRCGPAF